MKPFTALLALLTLLVCGLTPSDVSAQSTVGGTWEVTLSAPTGPMTLDATVVQSGEDVTGELTTPLGTAPFKGTFIGDALTLSAVVDVQGNTITLAFAGKLAQDALSGTVKFGDFGEAPWSAKRKPAAAVTPPADPPTSNTPLAPAASTVPPDRPGISGVWAVTLTVGPGIAMLMTATLAQDGTMVTGTISGERGESPVTGTMSGTSLTLNAPMGRGVTMTLAGELGPKGLAGNGGIGPIGGILWTAVRK